MIYTMEDIYAHKKTRMEMQKALMKAYQMPLLFIKVNYPCSMKDNNLTNCIATEIDKLVTDIFEESIEYKIFRNTAEGPNIVMIINESLKRIKEITVAIEDNHVLGRIIQITIYDSNSGDKITREEIGAPPRKCILCSNNAAVCVKEKNHTKEETIREINRTYIEYLETFYGVLI